MTNTITGDFYIGSSKNVKRRWIQHKSPSIWNRCPNKQLYLDMRKFGVNGFVFEILAEVEADKLKETEQKFIEALKPTYNNYNANGLDIERQKESKKECDKKYRKTEKYKEYQKEYRKSERYKEYQKEYGKSDKRKKYQKEYNNQLCSYNGETLTLCALSKRFMRQGISNPVLEAKKYLIKD